jgi:hypothetical protein
LERVLILKKLKFYSLISLTLLTVFTWENYGITKPFAIEAVSMAKLTKVIGEVQLFSNKKWLPIKKNQIIKINDNLKTGNKSRAELTFSNGTRIRLAENTNIILIQSKNSKKNDTSSKNFLKVLGGHLWANIFNNSKDKFAIEGNTAVLAVLGTTFEVEAEKLKTDVSVFEGSVGIQLLTNNEELNNNLDNLKLESDKRNISDNIKPVEINKPVHEVEKPVKIVPGPYEISKDKWLEIVENQKISINDQGIGVVSNLENDEVKADEWIQWNKELDSNTAENILLNNK